MIKLAQIKGPTRQLLVLNLLVGQVEYSRVSNKRPGTFINFRRRFLNRSSFFVEIFKILSFYVFSVVIIMVTETFGITCVIQIVFIATIWIDKIV